MNGLHEGASFMPAAIPFRTFAQPIHTLKRIHTRIQTHTHRQTNTHTHTHSAIIAYATIIDGKAQLTVQVVQRQCHRVVDDKSTAQKIAR